MHFMGFVFVKEPTVEAVKAAMEDHGGDNGGKWDWYRCGGRWDGYFGGEDEMKSRETHNGFNFEDRNNDAARNAMKVADLKPDHEPPYFFVSDYSWVPKQYYNEFEKSKHGSGFGAILDTPHFADRYADALKANADGWVVVVDAHN